MELSKEKAERFAVSLVKDAFLFTKDEDITKESLLILKDALQDWIKNPHSLDSRLKLRSLRKSLLRAGFAITPDIDLYKILRQ